MSVCVLFLFIGVGGGSGDAKRCHGDQIDWQGRLIRKEE